MEITPDHLIDKFVSGKRLTDEEFVLMDKLLSDLHYHKEMNKWLEKKWQESQPEKVTFEFKEIKGKIRTTSFKSNKIRLLIVLSRAAAILFLPILAAAIYFYFAQTQSGGLLTLSTQKGEQTAVILPDGSKIWLNVDTKLSYHPDYGVSSRDLELEGEAYFEVSKNPGLPMEVKSGNIKTKVLGTQFVISAYPDDSEIKSSLVSGSLEVECGKVNEILKPGQQLVYHKNKSKVKINSFDENYELAWKNNQLLFRLTPFDKVVSELEKWYDINIEYNPVLFKSETLTVRFEQYETLEQVLRVIAKAVEFKYSIKGKNVIIKK